MLTHPTSQELENYETEKWIRNQIAAAKIPLRHSQRNEFLGKEWNEKFDSVFSKIGTGALFAFRGDRGTGKTQMACEIAKKTINQLRKTSLYTTAMDIFIEFKVAYKTHETEKAIIADFLKPQLLIVDEITQRGETEWENRLFSHILDKRYCARKDTIVIGNLKPEVLSGNLGESVVSRLNETGGIVNFDWKSFRS